MFYYVDQAPTPFFPIGLIKTEFDFIVRSVETGLRRWTLVVFLRSLAIIWVFSEDPKNYFKD